MSIDNSDHEWVGFSLTSILFILLGFILFGFYVNNLLTGENSLQALTKLTEEKRTLQEERKRLKTSNQKLQKEYFELMQLNEPIK